MSFITTHVLDNAAGLPAGGSPSSCAASVPTARPAR